MKSEQTFSSSCRIRVHLLGSLSVSRRTAEGDWQEVSKDEWGKVRRSAQSVLKHLLASPGRRLSRGRLLEDLWPDADFDLAEANLSNALTKIRTVIGRDLLETISSLYEVADQSRVWVDIDACASLLKEAENQGGAIAQTLPLLEETLSYLERGEYLEGEEGTWCYAARKKSEDMLRQCRLWLAANYETQGKLYQAGEQYRALLQTIPPDENALERWMSMLQRQGKTQDALKCYRDTRGFFEEQGCTFSPRIVHFATRLEEQSERELLSLSSPVPSLVFFSETIPLPLPENPQSITDLARETESFTLFLDITRTCRRLSEGSELKTAERILWAYLPRVEGIAKQSLAQRHEAAHITSQGFLLAASLAGHRNDLRARRYYSEEAFLYGKLAEDRDLQITALRQLAITFDYLGRLDEVLHIYQRTFPHLNEASPLLQACIYADLSGAYAQLKREKEAFHFLEMAYEHFPKNPEHEPDFLSTICRYATLVLCDGLHRLSFGQPREAEAVFAQIDGIHPKSPLPERIRIDLLNCQAETFFVLEDLEQACTYLETAVYAAVALGSERRLKESSALFQQMQQTWPHELRIKQLQDLFFNQLVKRTE